MTRAAPRTGPECPRCGRPAHRERANDGFVRNFCCGLTSWNGHPLREQSGEVYAAQAEAHAAFDPLWRDGLVPRAAAYAMLAIELGVAEPRAHMRAMDVQTARRVPQAVLRIRERLGAAPEATADWDWPEPSWRRE